MDLKQESISLLKPASDAKPGASAAAENASATELVVFSEVPAQSHEKAVVAPASLFEKSALSKSEFLREEADSGAKGRPAISDFQEPVEFLKAVIDYRKKTEKDFSVHDSTKALRKVSPSLVSLVLKGKRKITLDRANEFAKLMQLNAREKIYFRSWIDRLEGPAAKSVGSSSYGDFGSFEDSSENRQDVEVHILNDWINVYVKDCFQLPKVQKNPELIYQYLASHAEPQRIKKSFEFLLREGYLRRTMDGSIVVETNLTVANPQIASKKIRQFHKGALSVAKSALEMFPPEERLANTLVVPLNPRSYEQLVELIQEFSEKLQEFAANNHEPGERLYQLILNLSPTGGKVE